MIRVGVIIARFQVPRLHEGHRNLIREALQDSDVLIFLLGCSELDGKTAENPLLFLQRDRITRDAMREIVNISKRFHVMPLCNSHSNSEWSRDIDSLIQSLYPACCATLYVSRDSIVPTCYRGSAKIRMVTPCESPSGTEIRAKIQPETTDGFIAGQTFALQYQFPHAYQCVDIAMISGGTSTRQVLMIKRADTKQWCLPGGFVDPSDPSLEYAAARELREETGLTCEGELRYICSSLIDDWRYRGRDKIMSALFLAPYSFGRPATSPEVDEWKWVPVGNAHNFVAASHKPLIASLQKAV